MDDLSTVNCIEALMEFKAFGKLVQRAQNSMELLAQMEFASYKLETTAIL